MKNLIRRARKYAITRHSALNQRRKYTGDPYQVHPASVANMVRHKANGTDEMVAAAWLHDTVEDTGASLGEIGELFGPKVAEMVEMLTDVSRPEDGNRATRKRIDLEHTAKASPEAKTIKLADMIDNTRSIVKHDPEFARVYLEEKSALLEVLREGDRGLYQTAALLLWEGKSSLQALSEKAEPQNDEHLSL